MPTGQKALRIAVSNAEAKKSAVAELVLQQLENYGPLGDASAGAIEGVDLLVTTGTEFSAKMVDRAALLILDATEANKKSLLGAVGFHTGGRCLGLFVAKVGPRHFRVIELTKDDSVSVQKGCVTPVDKTQPLPAELLRSAGKKAVVYDRPDLAVEGLASTIFDHLAEQSGDGVRKAADPVIPPAIKKWQISYTLVKKAEIKNFGKTQNPSMSITFDILALLNNPESGPHYQYIYIHQKGVVHPGELMDYAYYYKGYGRFEIETSLSPQTHRDDLVYDASSPANVNDQRVVSSKIGFSVQYGNASFNYEEGISQDVFDWQIIEKTQSSNMAWTFAERYPVNYPEMICDGGNSDQYPFYPGTGSVKPFPDLTRYTLQPQTQSVWRTTKVLNEPVTIGCGVWQSFRYFWYRFLWLECPGALSLGIENMTVDLSKVAE
jgi:hypothetical protein